MDLLRISTAGSVDDGKSTLIGRLLYDSKALTKEQEAHIEKKTKEKGLSDLDFSVITDGLIAEREQGITIDVAHIYFSSKDRKFIIADSPGHIEYTRNMVTGASNAELSIILIDARKGLLEQSHRHFFISQLLRLHTVIFCINKMDLVDYNQSVFDDISGQIANMLQLYEGGIPKIHIVPISSLKGDNIVHRSSQMPWYQEATLSEWLHNIQPENNYSDRFRFDIQNVLHVQSETFQDYRAYTGRVISGEVNLGDTVEIFPSKITAKITEIRRYETLLSSTHKGESITLSIDTDIDISRGALLTDINSTPDDSKNIHATIVWLDEDMAKIGDKFIIRIGARSAQVKLQTINYLVHPEHPKDKKTATELHLNDISSVNIRLAQPMYFDSYADNKPNGAFILIHPMSHNTCAVGFVE